MRLKNIAATSQKKYWLYWHIKRGLPGLEKQAGLGFLYTWKLKNKLQLNYFAQLKGGKREGRRALSESKSRENQSLTENTENKFDSEIFKEPR